MWLYLKVDFEKADVTVPFNAVTFLIMDANPQIIWK